MNQEEKPDLSKWTIKQLVNSLTARNYGPYFGPGLVFIVEETK